MGRTILVIDDEPAILTLIRHRLEHDGFRVITAEDGLTAWDRIRQERPDLIVLDLMLPGLPGLDLLSRIRSQYSVPVIVLTARKEEVDRVVGLEMGADDYVTKPFSVRELSARIKAMFRRQEDRRDHSAEIHRHGIVLNSHQRWATVHGKPVSLTATEFSILALLLENPGRVFSRQDLFRHVWGYDVAGGDTRTINVHIKNLRDKLGDAQTAIETVRGVGYRVRPDS